MFFDNVEKVLEILCLYGQSGWMFYFAAAWDVRRWRDGEVLVGSSAHSEAADGLCGMEKRRLRVS
jgi:hypothetical protein